MAASPGSGNLADLMRLFVAVDLDETVRTAAARLVEELQRRLTRLAPRARVTWVTPDRMHLTLRFIGEVDAAQANAVERALGPRLEVTAFDMLAKGAGVFPSAGPPRVVWLGLTDHTGRLGDLHRAISARLAGAGVPADSRPFSPHLTLGRVREAAGLRRAGLLEGLATIEIGRLPVSRVVLMESQRSPRGPHYTERLATPLES